MCAGWEVAWKPMEQGKLGPSRSSAPAHQAVLMSPDDSPPDAMRVTSSRHLHAFDLTSLLPELAPPCSRHRSGGGYTLLWPTELLSMFLNARVKILHALLFQSVMLTSIFGRQTGYGKVTTSLPVCTSAARGLQQCCLGRLCQCSEARLHIPALHP